MDLDRHHHRTTSTSSATSELFICFTSRLSSSSSMKLSKSILSPGRARDPPVSLSTSLSRRLRTNGSIKGGASPMFPGRKRGCAFENPEPSSPKVTCIGQVRVKTKKKAAKAKQARSLSRRRSGEMSFRKMEQDNVGSSQNDDRIGFQHPQRFPPANSSVHYQQQECVPHRNQRWVHLPLTICEALRAFGAEFSCLFPCRSSCFSSSNQTEKEEKANSPREERDNGQSSCGAVLARWLVSLQDGEGGKGREIELVVADGDDEEEKAEVRENPMRNSRRHVFEDIDFRDASFETKGGEIVEEEKARVSICIPPKNALLLMRCRSDPVKMAALANKFWESPTRKDDVEDDDEEDDKEDDGEENVIENPHYEAEDENEVAETEDATTEEHHVSGEVLQKLEDPVSDMLVKFGAENEEEEAEENPEEHLQAEKDEREDELEFNQTIAEEDDDFNLAALLDEEFSENPVENTEEGTISSFSSTPERSIEEDNETEETEKTEEAGLAIEAADGKRGEESTFEVDKEEQDSNLGVNEEEKVMTRTRSESEIPQQVQEQEEEQKDVESKTKTTQTTEDGENEEEGKKKMELRREESESSSALPDCLLLMMCEPKLSMEVSKETWVCSTDFLRWLPERRQVKAAPKKNVPDSDESKKKKKVNVDSNLAQFAQISNCKSKNAMHQQQAMQPPRSSCSLPAAAVSMASMIEQKLVNAVAYEPFVLTRCKSEPMRTAAKLAPEACFWKNRDLEPHRRATFGVGAAGVGF